jgi:pimeloyl-ACP methyl ester carboxylesterase
VAIDELGSGSPLVLVHRLGTTREVWRHVGGALAEERRVIALDVPGFGDSPPAGPGFELDAVADRMAGAAAERAGEAFDLIGHSLGGALAVLMASRHPRAVRTLVLVAPAGLTPRPRVIGTALGAASGAFLGARRVVGTPLTGSALARRLLLWGPVADGRRLRPEDADFLLAASAKAKRLREALGAIFSRDLGDDLVGLRLPVGAIWGRRDRIVPVAAATRLGELRPETPLELIDDAGHVVQLEDPGGFLAALGRIEARLEEVTV